MRKRTIPLMIALCLSLILSGCGHELASYRPIEDVNNLEGRKVGVTVAWASDCVLSNRDGEDLILYRYDNTAEMLMALYYHQIDSPSSSMSLSIPICKRTQGVLRSISYAARRATSILSYSVPMVQTVLCSRVLTR